ncbi:MAG TPA: flagellar type III secretion system protein FliR [Clostridiales bacterium]|nr:flagellar type III secretion system protein FliR [Clostridiales bacterium]
MEELLSEFYRNFGKFLLVFTRMTGLFILSPIFGRRNVPPYLKIGFCFLISVIIVDIVPGAENILGQNLLAFSLKIGGELLIGLIIGYITTLTFYTLFTAGQIIDTQIGFGIVNVMDPRNEIQVPMVGNFLFILALLLFFMANGHHMLIKFLYESYGLLPVGQINIEYNMVFTILEIFIGTFIIAVKLAVPILAALLLTEAALGILARTVPQMNIFVVGMPLRIIIGMLTLYFIMPLFAAIMEYIFDDMYSNITVILRGLAGQ